MASMGMKIYAGRTVCLPIPGPDCPHLFIALTGGKVYQESKVAVVNFTSFTSRRGSDSTVVVEAGEHSFIRVRTVINYKDAFIANAGLVQQAVMNGSVKFEEDCSDALLERIQLGALRSSNTPNDVVEMVKTYLGVD